MNAHASLTLADTGIIVAADVGSLEQLCHLVETFADIPEVVALKIGFSLALRHGLPDVVAAVARLSAIPVIYDHQKAGTDIPQMGKPFAKVCQDAGVRGVIFFPQAGPRTLEGFVTAAIESRVTPIVGLVMTHDAYLKSEGGYIVDDAPERMADAAIKLGVTDFVLPGTKPDVVKRFGSGSLSAVSGASIMMPGIGSQGGSLKTAFRAAKPHRRFAIIGSAVYGAKEPRTALRGFVEEMRNE
ncbi:MAG TPA: orotidine 5'-phosphate decarboxylase / HUMPS family protein [Candidatus Eisenbacteria bacterium]|jgi:orotidine-5'-phosphate decarboxylase|nr:orotidine 5'-phosphate decarboxylase / HUMPS family protein [Candidatus Eisenbacteria bacterium]